MERAGDAFTLVTPEDHEMVRELEKIMGQKLPKLTLEDYDYSVAAPAKPVVSQRPPRQTLAARGVKVISRPASRFQQNHRTGNK
ncbi:MAG TPA: hypothetical protein DEP80_02585 [Anaerolineae bacterium]|nr:hypothetical protein [Anaerolineae bacterium]